MDQSELRAELADLHPASFGWALSCCRGDRPRAEDVLQSAYLKVLEGRARFGGRSAFKTWFFGVVRNCAREERRRHLLASIRLLKYEPVTVPPPDPADEMLNEESNESIRYALSKISPRQQEVLHLVFYQGLTIEEAASVMAVSPGSARTHYERGKKQLRKRLKEESDEP